jgi:hypothetical protein
MLQPPVPLLGLPQSRFGVEVHVAEDVFELGLVGVLRFFVGRVASRCSRVVAGWHSNRLEFSSNFFLSTNLF